jgi:hypothetical protein
MFGSLLSTTLRIATLPIDATNIGLDIVAGGDGSKRSREDSPLSLLEGLRDRIAETAKSVDD